MNKVINLLLFLSGLCYGLESSHHYTYKYRGHFLTSIPGDGEQRSGWRMDALVHVFLENDDGIALFKLSNVRSGVFNEDPLEEDFEEASSGETPSYNDVINDEEEELHLSKALEEPFRANLRTSHPFAMEYKKTDPGWVTNVRKGIVSLFRNEILNGNYETQVEDSVSKVFHQGHLLNTFKVKEETIFGICTTNYQIHKIPPMVLPNNEDLIPTSNEDNKDLWRLDRSVDFDDCRDIVSTHIHTTNNVKYKDQKPRFQRYSHSTYILTGSPGHFDLYSTMTEGSTVFPLSFFSEQEAESVVKQKLVFVDHNIHDFPTLGQDLQHSRTWMYEVLSSSPAPNVDNELHPWIVHPHKDDEVFDYETYGMSKLSPDQIAATKVSILDLVKEASLMLTDMNQEAKKTNKKQSISEMLQNAAFHFRFLKKEDVLKIFDHFYENKDTIEMNLAFDAAVSSGFPEPMEAIMDYITANRLSNSQISMIFAMLTRNSYGSLNTARMMDYLLEQELSALHLNFAHYLSEFCIHKVHNHIPTDEGAACGSSLITERFIPYLKNIIYNDALTWERAFGVKVLGLLRSRFAFEILSPFIDGSLNSSFPLKVMAIRALKKWSINPEDPLRNSVTDLLTDVYTDVSQNFHVRAAALRTLISWEPSSDFWFSLALSTWKEPSGQFVAFVSSLIKVYAEGKPPVNHLQSERAAFAYKYAKHSKSSSSIETVRSDEFFDKEVRLSLHLAQQLILQSHKEDSESFISLFADNDELYKVEKEILYFEKDNPQIEPFNTDHLQPPQAKEFIDKLLREIHLLRRPEYVNIFKQIFTKVVNDVFNVESIFFDNMRGPVKLNFYLQMMDKSDFHPNELGLITIVHSSWPTVLSINIKPKTPGDPSSEALTLFRVSSTYSKGISVLLPWNKRFSTAMVRSNMEITLPIEFASRRIETEEYHKTIRKSALEIFYQKKFPLLRISNTPMTMIYALIPKGKTPILSTKVVRKVDLKTISKGAIEPVTGIRFDIEASAETRTRFGLFSFLQFPKMPFGVWSFDFYLNLEESETEELSIIFSKDVLFKEDGDESRSESTEDKSEEDSEENNISSNDSFKERSQKLLKQMGGEEVIYNECKLLFTGKEKTRKYEIFFAYNADKFPDSLNNRQRKTKHAIGIISDIHPLLCINFGSTNLMFPVANPLESSVAALGADFPIAFFQFKMLRECYETISQYNVTFEFTEEKLREMKKYCKRTYNEENCYLSKDELPDFDVVKVFLRNQKKLYTGTPLDDIILQSPELYFLRNAYQEKWDLYLRTASEDIHLSSFPDYFFSKNYPLTHVFTPENFVNYKPAPPKCTIKTNSVETFDGVKFDYELSNCWTVGSITSDLKNVFLIRKPQSPSSKIPDIKFILFDMETEIEFSNNELKINGTVADRITENENDAMVVIEENFIYKKGSTYIILYAPYITALERLIIRRDRIQFLKRNIGEKINGVCGNGDGEAYPEFYGPKHCLHRSSQVFVESWTGQSDNCDAAALGNFRERADANQLSCREPGVADIKMNSRCLVSGWKVMKLDDEKNSYCITAAPLPSCTQSCDISRDEKIKVTYKCWPKEEAPELVVEAIENKVQIVSHSTVATPSFYHRSSVTVATLCKDLLL